MSIILCCVQALCYIETYIRIRSNVTKHPEPNKIKSNLLNIPKINNDFFALAGMFYRREHGDSKMFWKAKLKTVVLPWAFCGTSLFLYEVLINGYEGSVKKYLIWMLGKETWLYFVPVLLECFAICKFANCLWKDIFTSLVRRKINGSN